MISHQNPSISVIIPSYNQGAFIERTLLSILKQDYKGRIEIIVSDGGSKDETVEILKKYDKDIIWWSAPDKGFVDAVMKGLNKATGDIIAIQSSDDYYIKDSFKNAAKAFAAYPHASFITGGQILINLNSQIVYTELEQGEIDTKRILFGKQPQQHSTFIQKQYIERVKGLRYEVDICADLDLILRIACCAEGVYIPKYIGVYQLQPNQRTKTSDKWYKGLTSMIESIQADPEYSENFNLSDWEKKSLYKYWEILWANMVGNYEYAKTAALKGKENIHDYDERTRNIISSYSNEHLGNNIEQIGFFTSIYRKIHWRIKHFLKAKSQKVQTESFIISADDLLWWKQ